MIVDNQQIKYKELENEYSFLRGCLWRTKAKGHNSKLWSRKAKRWILWKFKTCERYRKKTKTCRRQVGAY